MLTSEITDEETIAEAQKGVFTGYSATTIPEEFADNVSFKSGSQGLLIKDIPNPVVFAVSLVRKPCVHDAKFCKLKQTQNEELNMNEEDKQFLQKLKEIVSFKGEKHEEPLSEPMTSDELKQELASFKSDFKAEIIAGVTQGVAQAIKEALSEPKKKPKKGEEEEEEGESEGNNTSNNEENTNSNNSDETGDEGNADEKNKNKKKKPPASTKGRKLHDGPQPPASTKSDSLTVYEIMGRNSRGQRIKE